MMLHHCAGPVRPIGDLSLGEPGSTFQLKRVRTPALYLAPTLGTSLNLCTAAPGRKGVGLPSSQAAWPSP
jgi:hypothetical protein